MTLRSTTVQRPTTAILLAAILTLIALACTLFAQPAAATAVAESPSCLSVCEAPPRVENPDPVHSLLVINVGWNTGNSATSSPLEAQLLPFYAKYFSGPVNDWFRRSAPAGLFQDWQVSEGGSYEIAAPFYPAPTANSCETGRAFPEIYGRGLAAARASGLNPDKYGVVAIVLSGTICGSRGIDEGRYLGISNTESTPMHELGHYLGLNHANSIDCTAASGQRAPFSGNCHEEEYGDPYDSMGANFLRLSFGAVYTNQLRWLNGQFFSVAAGDVSKTFTIKPFTDPSHPARAVQIRDGANTFWLEYRRPVGIDDPAYTNHSFVVEPGIVVHREVFLGGAGRPTSQLLDMTPETGTFLDARLPLGQTWTNPLGEMQVRVDATTDAAATVTISSQRRTVPDVVDMTRKAAIAAIEAAGFPYGGLTPKFDPSCDFIHKVMAQTPAAGSRVLPGTRVSITEGVEDRTQPCK